MKNKKKRQKHGCKVKSRRVKASAAAVHIPATWSVGENNSHGAPKSFRFLYTLATPHENTSDILARATEAKSRSVRLNLPEEGIRSNNVFVSTCRSRRRESDMSHLLAVQDCNCGI